MRFFAGCALLLAANAAALPPLPPAFPAALRPDGVVAPVDVPPNLQVVAFGTEPVNAAEVFATVTGVDDVAMTPLGCCALRLDFTPPAGDILVTVSGPVDAMTAAYVVGALDDVTAPAAPAGLALSPLLAVSFIEAPMEAWGQAGVESRASFELGEDAQYVVVLADDGSEIGFLAARPGANSLLVGAPLPPDGDTLCLGLVAVDAAGNRSPPSPVACATLALPTPPDGCSCSATRTAGTGSALAAVLLLSVALRSGRRRAARRLWPLSMLVLAVAAGCVAEPPPFDDGTFAAPLDREDFEANAIDDGGDRLGLNTLVLGFDEQGTEELRFHRRGRFRYHDEWYYFRLLNGETVRGSDAVPTEGLSFAHVDEIYAWAAAQETLPYAMEFVDDGARLVSDEFYQLAHRADPRRFAAVMILDEPAADGSRRVVWRGSYRDPLPVDDIVRIFALLDAAVDLGAPLAWRTNSAEQEAAAAQLPPELAARVIATLPER